MKLVLATNNPHKRREFAVLLQPHDVQALPAAVTLPPETGSTFTENALVKARAAAAATGTAAVADDSGIAAEALGGAPGVYSARYAGPQASDEENLHKLMREVPTGSRLTYVCSLVLVNPGSGGEQVFVGLCEGTMAAGARGSGGFGYDPVFVPDAASRRTMAELSAAEKDAISHRGRAARALLAWLSGVAPSAG